MTKVNKEITQEQLELEILRREKIRRESFRKKFSIEAKEGFWEFCKYIDPLFFLEEKTLLKELVTILHDVTCGIYKKVVISMMPRSGKSYTVSMWCLWMLGHFPDKTIMRNTYGARLANKFSRDIRNMIGIPGERETEVNKKVAKVFPHLKLSADKKSVEEWALITAKDVSYFCGGAGGAITGLGCNLAMILDDPIKNIEEAQSENRLEDIESWYHSTHRTRAELSSGCAEIIIMTRWSIRDTIGQRLASEKNEWKEFIYPAIKDEKSICEAIAPTNELLKIRQGMIQANMESVWWALYMGQPYEEKGRLFPPTNLKRFTKEELKTIDSNLVMSFVDFADGGGDFFAAIFGLLDNNLVYIVDVLFSKKSSKEIEAELMSKILVKKPLKMIFESNSGGKLYARMIRKQINSIINTSIQCKRTDTNKMSRIISWSGIIIDNFRFLSASEYSPGSYYDLFMKNLTSFTRDGKNKNDDAPDCCSGLAAAIGIKSKLKFHII